MKGIDFKLNQSNFNHIHDHLVQCDMYFMPKLSETLNIGKYAKKIQESAIRVEAWSEQRIVGLVAFYFNQDELFSFITNVSVNDEYKGKGIAKKLIEKTILKAHELKCLNIKLEVNKANIHAIKLYELFDFVILKEINDNYLMKKIL